MQMPWHSHVAAEEAVHSHHITTDACAHVQSRVCVSDAMEHPMTPPPMMTMAASRGTSTWLISDIEAAAVGVRVEASGVSLLRWPTPCMRRHPTGALHPALAAAAVLLVIRRAAAACPIDRYMATAHCSAGRLNDR